MKPIIQLLSNNIAQRKQKMLQTALAEPLVEQAILGRPGIKAVIRMAIEEGRINEGSISRDSVQLCWIAEESAKLDEKQEERRKIKSIHEGPNIGARDFIRAIKNEFGNLEPELAEYSDLKLRWIFRCRYLDREVQDPYIIEAVSRHIQAEYELLKEAKFPKEAIRRSARGLGIFGVNEIYAEAEGVFGADGWSEGLAKTAASHVFSGRYKSISDAKEAYDLLFDEAGQKFGADEWSKRIAKTAANLVFGGIYKTIDEAKKEYDCIYDEAIQIFGADKWSEQLVRTAAFLAFCKIKSSIDAEKREYDGILRNTVEVFGADEQNHSIVRSVACRVFAGVFESAGEAKKIHDEAYQKAMEQTGSERLSRSIARRVLFKTYLNVEEAITERQKIMGEKDGLKMRRIERKLKTDGGAGIAEITGKKLTYEDLAPYIEKLAKTFYYSSEFDFKDGMQEAALVALEKLAEGETRVSEIMLAVYKHLRFITHKKMEWSYEEWMDSHISD